jgi:hypothetical protein
MSPFEIFDTVISTSIGEPTFTVLCRVLMVIANGTSAGWTYAEASANIGTSSNDRLKSPIIPPGWFVS